MRYSKFEVRSPKWRSRDLGRGVGDSNIEFPVPPVVADHVPRFGRKLLEPVAQRFKSCVILHRGAMCSDAKRRIPAIGTPPAGRSPIALRFAR
jgi:hypothetical protein